MRKPKFNSLYSRRWAVGQGWHWQYERDVSKDSESAWLTTFRKDEPTVTFIVSKGRPLKSATPN